jgi:hypothetical protein
MNINWLVTATWAGNLTNVPLHGRVVDFIQIKPGLIQVAIECESHEVQPQVQSFLDPNEPYCSKLIAVPYFPRKETNDGTGNTQADVRVYTARALSMGTDAADTRDPR